VNSADVSCRHCGLNFLAVVRPPGTYLNALFRLLLGVWAMALPAFCIWVGLTAPRGWGDIGAYLTSQIYFVPWIEGIVSLGVLVLLTEEHR
jgi:hypothetical protein